MIVREFNEAGIESFRAFLDSCRSQPASKTPVELLEDDQFSAILDPSIEVERRPFRTRGDAATYLNSKLLPLSQHKIEHNAGLWTWLTLYYFDQVCPTTNGKYSVKNNYHYIFEPENPRHFYRHLLFVAWRIIRLAPDHNRLYLGGDLSRLDGVTTEIMKRLFITRIPCMFEVLDRIYWDNEAGRSRKGVVGTGTVKRGDLTHRLPLRIRQLERTYDLYSLNADQMLELLGEEFKLS